MESDREAGLVKAAAARIRKRHREREERAVARRERARRFARDLATRLGEADEELEKVIGFGSTFESWRNYRLDSDIDLGVEGGDWFTLTRAIPDSEFEVSIIELDQQGEEFRRLVLERGEVLYEKR